MLKRLLRVLPLLLAAWALPGGAVAPDPTQFRGYGVLDGLPSSLVFMVAQDHSGYLWLATGDGLVRYDGVGFEVWQHAPDDPASLPSNMVQAVHVDPQDRVWVGMEGAGVAVLDAARSGFRSFRRATHPEIGGDEVYSISATPDGSVWFGGYLGGLHRIDPEGRVQRFMPVEGEPDSLPAEIVTMVSTSPDGELWVATTAGIARWNGSGFDRVGPEHLSGPVAMSIAHRADGGLLIGTRHGVDEMPSGMLPAPVRLADGSAVAVTALSILPDRDGGRWYATPRGVYREEDGRIARLGGAMAEQSVHHVFEDREGGVWFATRDAGLLRLSPDWRRFAVLRRQEGRADTPSMSMPRGFAESADGRVWMVGEGGEGAGLDRVDPVARRVERVPLPPGAVLPSRSMSVLETRSGEVWVGGRNRLVRLDFAAGRSEGFPFTDEPELEQGAQVGGLLEDGSGHLWALSFGAGVQQRDRDGRLIRHLRPGAADGVSAGDNEQMVLGPDGVPWLAGGRGVLRWSADAARFERVEGGPTDRVFTLAWEDGHLWLHRFGGLEQYRWDGSALQRIRQVGSAEGLAAVESGGLMIGADGLWLTTLRGLVHYRPQTRGLRLYGLHDGLPADPFNADPGLLTRSGYLLAGTHGAVLVVEPAALVRETEPAPLRLHRVSLRRGDRILDKDPAVPFRLAPGDSDLRVSARLLSFANPAANRYQFRLSGQDADWVEVAGGERVFSRLPAGRYRLEVRAANADGVWSDATPLPFEVDPPLWASAWALLAYAMAGLGMALWLAHGYRQRLRRRHVLQLAEQRRRLAEEASEAKTRFLATLGHEVRTPMTGVLGMAELLRGTPLDPRQRGYVDSIHHAGEHLLRLVNDALDLARIESGRLELRVAPFDLHALLAEVCGLLAPLAGRKGLAFHCDIAPDAPGSLSGDVDRVRQILLNLGTNAIKFTEQGEVRIGCEPVRPHGVRLRVSDTGPGLSTEQQGRLFRRFEQADGERTRARYGGSGLGLAISQELAAAMGGRIAVESRAGSGSTFTVSLPLEAAEAPAMSAAGSVRRRAMASTWQVLLVEDDATVAQVMIGLLEAMGHTVTHVPHGLAALTELGQRRFDIALLDLDLPGVDGLELARLIRRESRTLTLLAVTARADAEAEPAALAAGMDGFLRKPVTGGLLAEAMDKARRRHAGAG